MGQLGLKSTSIGIFGRRLVLCRIRSPRAVRGPPTFLCVEEQMCELYAIHSSDSPFLQSSPSVAAEGQASPNRLIQSHHYRFPIKTKISLPQSLKAPFIKFTINNGLLTILLTLATLFTQLELSSSAQVSSTQHLAKRGHSLQKRAEGNFAGRSTFYDPGLGACGNYNGPGDFIVALNANQFTANKWCGKKIKIFFGGKNTIATIVDECPGCPTNGLDMSPSLFEFFASKDVGVFYMSWSLVDGSSDPPAPAPAPKPAPSPPPPPPPPPPSTSTQAKKEDPTPAPKKDDPTPVKKDDPPTPTKQDPPPPAYTQSTVISHSNPFAAFQSGSNTAALASRPVTITNTASSTGFTNNGATYQSTSYQQSSTNVYATGGNLDAINQLVISFGALAAASAGNALNNNQH
ncbi:hypothetical protein Pst134EB_013979 [Puccinia striiformis f. sp. tritici]|nr:hypothetical protein Pst134EB_013979 [Puccinia striiformis f. sp. tritici]